jgi:glucose/arabinose dehydrogenase
VTDGWSCGDFPCADDINDFLRRIQVPRGFAVSHYGRFPGQPMQIAFGRDGRLYATVLENGTRSGAVYALNSDGSSERYAGDFLSPVGLAFQPGTDVLYVSARSSEATGGALYRVQANGDTRLVLDDLPCCFSLDNQPNGMVFGPDGYLYLGVGSLTDRAEPPDPRRARFAEIDPLEASVLRIQPHTGAVEAYARGIRNPYDVAFDSSGTFYASDQGLLTGAGDRLLRLETGGHYGFPYWVGRGFCAECPFTPPNLTVLPDLLPLPDFTLPRGMVVYDGVQFPSNMFDSLFVAFWNGGDNGQRIVRIEPNNVPTDAEALALYTPEAFATGFIRPVDVIVAPDGALLVADFVYGHVWRIGYEGIP